MLSNANPIKKDEEALRKQIHGIKPQIRLFNKCGQGQTPTVSLTPLNRFNHNYE